ncbi:hypothetical protein FQN54_006019 [Arachnomyces sp. PD_36]|nr:hypothetical protein FQN54_006019 [Arachnomyces sp. PD_36]
MPPTPITIITGFLGSGKTTILLNLLPQLPPTYRLALLKNEFGDLAIDSQLTSQISSSLENTNTTTTNNNGNAGNDKPSPISGVRELLNGCICCNLVGQLGDALRELQRDVKPDRIVIETSGSAFPATLAMEVNRLSSPSDPSDPNDPEPGFTLDGVISVIDVENWAGYEDTSYTAKMQARYTDLIIYNKWEGVGEERVEVCRDRVGDLEVETAWVRSERGRVERDVLLGIDGAMVAKGGGGGLVDGGEGEGGGHGHEHGHQSEVEVLSISLRGGEGSVVDVEALEKLLNSAPKDEVYRIKGIMRCSTDNPPKDSSGDKAPASLPSSNGNGASTANETGTGEYILNWAFGRWTFTPTSNTTSADSESRIAQITMILARHESTKWRKKIEAGGLVESVKGGERVELKVERLV